MSFMFATCDRDRALGFLRAVYPTRAVEDTPECAGPLLDLVEADIMRVPDPDYHAPTIQPGTHWDESKREECVDICRRFHESVLGESA